MKVAGVNLNGIKKISSICLIENQNLSTFSARTNEQILEVLNNAKPKIIVINAPLFLKKEMRECEKEMVKSGFNFSLRDFDEREEIWGRAIRIKNTVERYAEVIETNSDVLKQRFKGDVEFIIKKFNLNQMNLIRNEEEKIAILCAITALLYERGEYQKFGNEEDFIVLPKT
jgi:predicted nuclease with RNAse H fold